MNVFEEAKQLSRVPLFAGLDSAKLKLLAFTSEQIQFTDGEYLFHLDDPSDSVYLLLKGVMQIVVEHKDGQVEVILDRHQNDLIGEMGVISNTPRSASIRAQGEAVVLRIEADAFMSLLTENASMSLFVMRELSERLNTYVAREREQTLEQAANSSD